MPIPIPAAPDLHDGAFQSLAIEGDRVILRLADRDGRGHVLTLTGTRQYASHFKTGQRLHRLEIVSGRKPARSLMNKTKGADWAEAFEARVARGEAAIVVLHTTLGVVFAGFCSGVALAKA